MGEGGKKGWLKRANKAGTIPERLTLIWSIGLVAGLVNYLVEEAGGGRSAQTIAALIVFVVLGLAGMAILLEREARRNPDGVEHGAAAARYQRNARVALVVLGVCLLAFVGLALATQVWEFLLGAALCAAGIIYGWLQQRGEPSA